MTTPIPYYGILVHTLPLVYASQAFSVVQSQLSTLNLISLRRRKGTLETSDGSHSLAKVPQEVWEMVKRELIEPEVAAAEEGSYKASFGKECPQCNLGDPAELYTSKLFERCDHALNCYVTRGAEHGIVVEKAKEIKSLLDAFGLSVVKDTVIDVPDDRGVNLSLFPVHALSPTAARLIALTPTTGTFDVEKPVTAQSTTTFFPSLPPSVSARFGTLLALFLLPTASIDAYSPHLCSSPRGGGNHADTPVAINLDAMKDDEKSGSEPRWMVFERGSGGGKGEDEDDFD